MSKATFAIVALTAGLGVGTYGLVHYARRAETVAVGQRAPDFRVVNLRTGDTLQFSKAYRGQVVLVNLWGTFCPPCIEEMPALEALYREMSSHGFRIAAVSVDEGDLKKVLDFAERFDLSFDILHDFDGSVQEAFHTTLFPESFLVDTRGIIVKKVLGAHPWSSDANREVVSQLLGLERAPPRPEGPLPAGSDQSRAADPGG
jgi:peroxiredoxin